MEPSLDRAGRTALHYAALEGRTADVVQLIAEGFDPRATDKQGMTPLHFAAQQFQPVAAELLCEAGAVVDASDDNGNTPLFRAVFDSRGRGDVIAVLMMHGADPDHANNSGVSPRMLADRIANFDIAQFLSR